MGGCGRLRAVQCGRVEGRAAAASDGLLARGKKKETTTGLSGPAGWTTRRMAWPA
jgi:hypothetical protein